MKFLIRGEKLENTASIKDYIESKLGRLEKYIKESSNIEAVVLTKKEGRMHKIEVTIPTKDFMLRNEVVNEDLYAAIDEVIDKLERQVRKSKEKLNHKKQRKIIEDFEYELEDDFIEDEVIVKRKKLDLKPMDEEEAILEMELLGHNFFVYKDSNLDEICIIYKRKNGNYGLIETK